MRCYHRVGAAEVCQEGLCAPNDISSGHPVEVPINYLFVILALQEVGIVAVRIRMKKMGRTHRHYFRIVAIDARQPRDGKVIEELGCYNPHDKDKEARVTLVPGRIKYWMSVGAKPSEKCQVFINKYLAKFEAAEAAAANPAPVTPATSA